MAKYKVNLKFKDTFKSLNELITEVLKIELQKKLSISHNIINKKTLHNHTCYSQIEGSNK